MRLHFIPIHIFRETPSVTFFDAGVPGSNGTDVVAHHGAAISPPDVDGSEQYYVHHHQVDHNLVLEGKRLFTLLNPSWDQPHHVIKLVRAMGALQIPTGTYHRSVSGEEGSMVLNQSTRDAEFNFRTEFIPVRLGDRADLQQAKAIDPWIWSWKDGHICREHQH
ncbi:MAG: hemagglutinin [Synechococcus sp.]